MVEKWTLDNGLRVVAQRIPHLRSISVGIFIKTGSVCESAAENGLSHFLEHMLFKGTESRTAREIALAMDAIGAQMNAFTSKEYTGYYAKTMDAHLHISLPLLADMVGHSLLEAAEIKKESGVILEEIAMVEDTPDDIVHDMLSEAQFGAHPLGQTILGPPENIARFSREEIAGYMARHYFPENCVLAISGNFDEAELKALCAEHFGSWVKSGAPAPESGAPEIQNGLLLREKDIEQVHICVGYPGLKMGHDDLYAMNVFNNIFGGSVSSRLFQKIREESGMAYSVYSYPTSYLSCGTFALYAGTGEQTALPVLRMLREETERLYEGGFTDEEFHWGREQMRGSYILAQEGGSSRMMAIGRGELLQSRVRTEQEVLARIEAVTPEDVARVMHIVLEGPCSLSAIGRIDDALEAALRGYHG